MDLIERQAAIDAIRSIKANYCETADDQILLIDKAMAMTELMMLPSAQPEAKTNVNGDWVILNKDKILKAGMEGREIEFRIGGRLFSIREKAQ